MCYEDLKMGRNKRARVDVKGPITGAAELLPADPNRTNFIVTSTGGLAFFISDKPMTATAQGLRIAPGNAALADFSVEDHGDFVYGAIYVWTDAADSISFVETSYFKDGKP